MHRDDVGLIHGSPACGDSASLAGLRERMQRAGQWGDHQIAGRRWAVGCVSLEITQRCNLDCSLCYLSESSEAIRDFPLEEIFRRIDLILQHYGPGTDVQVSGGEPTLRPRHELVAIVRRLAQLGLRPSLLTNGIKASRELLTQLAQAGLVDVDGTKKAVILAQVGHFYFGAVGQYYSGGNKRHQYERIKPAPAVRRNAGEQSCALIV